MSRIRTIKPELFADEKLIECSVDARFLFIGLLPFLNDMGRAGYHPRRIKIEVFPADDEFTPEVVDGLIQELAKVGVVELYEVGKHRYLRVPHFLDHQYVKKPSHTTIPPSPSEGLSAKQCKCYECERKANGKMFPQEHPHQYGTSDTPVGDEWGTSTEPVPHEFTGRKEGSKGSKGGREGVEDQNQNPPPSPQPHQTKSQATPTPASAETTAQDRRAQLADLREIAMRILELVGIPSNSQILDAVTESVRVKSRSEGVSVEEAARQIAGKACIVKRDSPPDSWLFWFRDAKYDYVPQGDAKLKDRRYEARPTCGGPQCNEGWEYVTVNGQRRLQRCAACSQLWRDQGLET